MRGMSEGSESVTKRHRLIPNQKASILGTIGYKMKIWVQSEDGFELSTICRRLKMQGKGLGSNLDL